MLLCVWGPVNLASASLTWAILATSAQGIPPTLLSHSLPCAFLHVLLPPLFPSCCSLCLKCVPFSLVHSLSSTCMEPTAVEGRGRKSPGQWWEGRGHLRSSVSWIWSPGQWLLRVWSPEFGCRDGQTGQGSVPCYLVLPGELGAPPNAKKLRLRGWGKREKPPQAV